MKRTQFLIAVMATCAIPVSLAYAETVSGCVEPGVEANCLVIKSGDDSYNVTYAAPKPEIGKYGAVTGTISTKVDICQQGTILEPSTWTPDPSKTCPASE